MVWQVCWKNISFKFCRHKKRSRKTCSVKSIDKNSIRSVSCQKKLLQFIRLLELQFYRAYVLLNLILVLWQFLPAEKPRQ